MGQLPGLGGEHHLTWCRLLLGQAALNHRPAGQQKLPTPTDPTDAEGHDLTGPDPIRSESLRPSSVR